WATGKPTSSESALSASAAHTPAARNGSTSCCSPAPTPCDTKTLTARNKPKPKQITVQSAMPPRPTPASAAEPSRPTNAVSTTVMTVNDSVDTVIGQARDTSSRNVRNFDTGTRELLRTGTGTSRKGEQMQKSRGTLRRRGFCQREI